MNKSLKSLYDDKRWDDFICLASSELENVVDSNDRTEIEFYIAASCMRLGEIDKALVLFRKVLENDKIDKKFLLNSCFNMGIIAHVKGDFEFSFDCAKEYYEINQNSVFSEVWMSIEKGFKSGDYDHRSAHRLLLMAENDLHKNFVQSSSAIYWTFQKKIMECEKFYRMLDNKIHMNVFAGAFEYYCDNNQIDEMKAIFDRFLTYELSSPSELLINYMKLRIISIDGGDRSELLSLADSIVSGIRSRAVFNSAAMLKACGQVFRATETRNRILVPSRFGLIGISPVMSELRDRIERFARSTSPVLIQGESGTGKELAAQALHDAGDRAAAPFIPVNCAAIPESVFESQLFGHVAGAFTGAAKDQPGLIELAGDGTLFLDEVGELPAGVQAKLLRFLENGEFRRLGSEQVRRSRARVVAATNRSLLEVEGFRQDLVHRLRRLELRLPPLRERREDIRYLARHRVRQLNLQDGSGWKQLEEAAEQALEALDYAGNVRELFNLVDHAWHEAVQLVGPAEVERARQRLEAEQAQASLAGDAQGLAVAFAPSPGWSLDFRSGGEPLRQIQERAACEAIRQALDHFSGDVDAAARFLDVSRRSIYRYLERERQLD